MSQLPEKDHEEDIPVQFDFSRELGPAAIVSTQVSIAVGSGNDSTPTAMLQGGPTVVGPLVTQWVTGGRPGVSYHLRCQAETDELPPRTLVIPADLPVVRA